MATTPRTAFVIHKFPYDLDRFTGTKEWRKTRVQLRNYMLKWGTTGRLADKDLYGIVMIGNRARFVKMSAGSTGLDHVKG